MKGFTIHNEVYTLLGDLEKTIKSTLLKDLIDAPIGMNQWLTSNLQLGFLNEIPLKYNDHLTMIDKTVEFPFCKMLNGRNPFKLLS